MKYKVTRVFEENNEVLNLIGDDGKIYPAAPDEFKEGEEVSDKDIYFEQNSYVDDQGTGTTDFAFKKKKDFDIVDPQKAHKLFKELNIDEANFTVKENTDFENRSFYYCNLDDKEFQFGENGSIVTNYIEQE